MKPKLTPIFGCFFFYFNNRWLQILMAFVKNTDEEADGAMSIPSDLIAADR